jgi:hypothetical protein
MKANEAIREIMNRTGTRMSALSNRLKAGTNTVSNRIAREGITVAKLSETIRAMDYKVVVVPIGARIPEGGFEVE